MTRGVKVRLIAFLLLSAVGVVYVAGSYLGIVDRVLGRGLHVHATLPESGGLFVGSEVTYRGYKVGKVTKMAVTRDGVRLDMTLKEGTRVPEDSPIEVHNLSAVGEQYLDILPRANRGPWLDDGDTLVGTDKSVPIGEDEVLSDISGLVDSIDKSSLTKVVTELGDMFRGTAPSLQHMVDSSSTLVAAAKANQQDTIDLFETGQTVLQTQARHEADIRSLAANLADLTQTLSSSDSKLRNLLQGSPATVHEVNSLLTGLEPTLPVFLSNLVTVNQVLTVNRGPLEEFLVQFPVAIAAGFTGTPGDGYGHINLQLNYSVPPCTDGYLPKDKWRPATDTTDIPPFIAQCKSAPPLNMRGTKYAPTTSSQAFRVGTYDASTGKGSAGPGESVEVGGSGGMVPMTSDDSWQWLLVGPVTRD